jgi:hypothetical protein
MKELINNILLGGLTALVLYGIFAAGQFIYRNHQESQARESGFNRFLSRLPEIGYQRLPAPLADQEEIRQLLERYYVLRNTRHPILELKATGAYGTTLDSFPAYFLTVYQKISLFGTAPGAGQSSGRSEFQGTVVAVRMPLRISGRVMVYRRPQTEDDDEWDWRADASPLGVRSYPLEAGLAADFSEALMVRSTGKAASLSPAVQGLLLGNKDLFFNAATRRSALVMDEHGWAFVSDILTAESDLNKVVALHRDLTQALKAADRSIK